MLYRDLTENKPPGGYWLYTLAVALGDGKIALDDPAARFVTAWQDDARKSKITVRRADEAPAQ